MSKEVTVTVSGLAASGKTFVSVVIEKALKDAGFITELAPNRDGDQSAKRKWLETEDLKHVFSNTSVTIVEEQRSRCSL